MNKSMPLSSRGCVKVKVAVLGSRSPVVPTVSVDVKHHSFIADEADAKKVTAGDYARRHLN